jgi:lycopene elongase/hydratase (dihydrobisanhydrobacterioruberin-forming)
MLGMYLKISRPRFWLYLLGPFLLGAAAAPTVSFSWRLLLLGLFFTYPANVLIYGFNDIFDYETDRHNQKKRSYEHLLAPNKRRPLLHHAALMGSLGLLLVLPAGVPAAAKWAMTGFYFFGLFYSAPPIRAKAKPLLDSLFNILYVFPALVSYGLLTGQYPPLQIILAAWLWCMAMHAYSAAPDIEADKKAGISTIATWLGADNTIIFCWLAYAAATGLVYVWLGWFGAGLGAIYQGLMLVSLINTDRERLFSLYRFFPYVNMLIGAALFFRLG